MASLQTALIVNLAFLTVAALFWLYLLTDFQWTEIEEEEGAWYIMWDILFKYFFGLDAERPIDIMNLVFLWALLGLQIA
jgi:hypothetical protein